RPPTPPRNLDNNLSHSQSISPHVFGVKRHFTFTFYRSHPNLNLAQSTSVRPKAPSAHIFSKGNKAIPPNDDLHFVLSTQSMSSLTLSSTDSVHQTEFTFHHSTPASVFNTTSASLIPPFREKQRDTSFSQASR
ncbi:hypothetical protein K439DRAFT_1642030, partial [Ramaria rubella]